MAGFNMDDYVDVAQRIHDFYERFPDGRLTMGSAPYLQHVGDREFIVYHAQAYRNPEDTHPGDGWAWEPVPGPTQFTRDSELQNAETAAWGRAIVALGFATKKIASKQEVRNRQGEPSADSSSNGQPKVISEAQRKRLYAMSKESAMTDDDLKALVLSVAGVESSKEIPVAKYDELCAAVEAAAVPF